MHSRLHAFAARAFGMYVLLLPLPIAAILRFDPHMPKLSDLMESAGPLGIIFIMRAVWLMASAVAAPAALILAFVPTRHVYRMVFISYAILAMVLVWAPK